MLDVASVVLIAGSIWLSFLHISATHWYHLCAGSGDNDDNDDNDDDDGGGDGS
jgi:hypothetical protein